MPRTIAAMMPAPMPAAGASPPVLLLLLLVAATPFSAANPGYFGIQVVDRATGRGVPRVKLTTTTNDVFVTDSAGNAAVLTAAYAGLQTWFSVDSDGYTAPSSGFNTHGVRLVVEADKNATVQVTRTQKAERLYRLTGQGIYIDTVLLGRQPPIDKPLLNAGVQGQDSILTALFGGVIHWFWGDTGRLSFPLGNFQSTGATSCSAVELQGQSPQDPPCLSVEEGVNLQYYVVPADPEDPTSAEFVAPMAKLPPQVHGTVPLLCHHHHHHHAPPPPPPWQTDHNIYHPTVAMSAPPVCIALVLKYMHMQSDLTAAQPHPTWLGGLAVIPAAVDGTMDDRSVMVASFMKAGPTMNTIGRGMVQWDSVHKNFSLLANWSSDGGVAAGCCGQPVTAATGAEHTTVTADGVDYVVFTGRGSWPLVTLRCKATLTDLSTETNYEGWTMMTAGPTAPKVARTAGGQLDWEWRKGMAPMTAAGLSTLAKAGHITAAEASATTAYDSETGLALAVFGGSTHWHEGREKWISIFGARSICPTPSTAAECQAATGHESLLGEIWYSEADALPGMASAHADAGERKVTAPQPPASIWANATKVATHNTSGLSCYNPLQHSFYSTPSRIFFSCTFVNTFSGVKEKEPLYDYNNIMFGLDLETVAGVRMKSEDEE